MFEQSRITVVVPSYKPDEKLLGTVKGILDAGFTDVCVVDDGGGKAYEHVFDEVRAMPHCTVLVHEVNRGKGAALKTAFKYIAENRHLLKNRPQSYQHGDYHIGNMMIDSNGVE